MNILKKITDRIRRLGRDPVSSRFVAHNRRLFPHTHSGKRQVLFEMNAMHSSHIAYSYLANVLAALGSARIRGYLPIARNTLMQRIAFAIDKFFDAKELGIYVSFGARDCLMPALTSAQVHQAEELFGRMVAALKSTQDVEDLTIDGVWIGDLVYDSYLMTYKQPTIVLSAPDFLQSLRNSINLFVFWNAYITIDNVSAINVSHCVYNQAIPLRIAVTRGIPVFQSTLTHIYRLSKDKLFAYNDFFYFRERFAALPVEVQCAGLKEAKKRIDRRFSGEVGVDMSYSSKSAYGEFKKERLINESPRKKILIATHCFFDSPHSYGNNLFPDFYEWLDFLGKMSLETDYDWYIKTHPDYLPGTKEIIDEFVARYPKLTLLPSDSSHHQLIAEGVSVALTVYGTIGFEYAALGIPVINASLNNPHIGYDFNLHPKTIEEYRQMLFSLDTLQFDIDKSQVYEYYFMARIFNTQNLFFDDYDGAINALSGYDFQFTPKVYQRWVQEWAPQKHENIMAALKIFIQSEDFRMDYRHFGRQFNVNSIGSK